MFVQMSYVMFTICLKIVLHLATLSHVVPYCLTLSQTVPQWSSASRILFSWVSIQIFPVPFPRMASPLCSQISQFYGKFQTIKQVSPRFVLCVTPFMRPLSTKPIRTAEGNRPQWINSMIRGTMLEISITKNNN
jgi:hypothetical protein